MADNRDCDVAVSIATTLDNFYIYSSDKLLRLYDYSFAQNEENLLDFFSKHFFIKLSADKTNDHFLSSISLSTVFLVCVIY